MNSTTGLAVCCPWSITAAANGSSMRCSITTPPTRTSGLFSGVFRSPSPPDASPLWASPPMPRRALPGRLPRSLARSRTRSANSLASQRSSRRCSKEAVLKAVTRVRKTLTAHIPTRPHGRPMPQAATHKARAKGAWQQNVTDLCDHRDLFVQHALTPGERKTRTRISRGHKPLRALRDIMDEVYRLFDRRCRSRDGLTDVGQAPSTGGSLPEAGPTPSSTVQPQSRQGTHMPRREVTPFDCQRRGTQPSSSSQDAENGLSRAHPRTYQQPHRTRHASRCPRIVHGTLLLLGALLAAALLWSAATKADLVVRALGRVRPMSSPMKVVYGGSGAVLSASMSGQVIEVERLQRG